jgi:hypothetical protein
MFGRNDTGLFSNRRYQSMAFPAGTSGYQRWPTSDDIGSISTFYKRPESLCG